MKDHRFLTLSGSGCDDLNRDLVCNKPDSIPKIVASLIYRYYLVISSSLNTKKSDCAKAVGDDITASIETSMPTRCAESDSMIQDDDPRNLRMISFRKSAFASALTRQFSFILHKSCQPCSSIASHVILRSNRLLERSCNTPSRGLASLPAVLCALSLSLSLSLFLSYLYFIFNALVSRDARCVESVAIEVQG